MPATVPDSVLVHGDGMDCPAMADRGRVVERLIAHNSSSKFHVMDMREPGLTMAKTVFGTESGPLIGEEGQVRDTQQLENRLGKAIAFAQPALSKSVSRGYVPRAVYALCVESPKAAALRRARDTAGILFGIRIIQLAWLGEQAFHYAWSHATPEQLGRFLVGLFFLAPGALQLYDPKFLSALRGVNSAVSHVVDWLFATLVLVAPVWLAALVFGIWLTLPRFRPDACPHYVLRPDVAKHVAAFRASPDTRTPLFALLEQTVARTTSAEWMVRKAGGVNHAVLYVHAITDEQVRWALDRVAWSVYLHAPIAASPVAQTVAAQVTVEAKLSLAQAPNASLAPPPAPSMPSVQSMPPGESGESKAPSTFSPPAASVSSPVSPAASAVPATSTQPTAPTTVTATGSGATFELAEEAALRALELKRTQARKPRTDTFSDLFDDAAAHDRSDTRLPACDSLRAFTVLAIDALTPVFDLKVIALKPESGV